MPVGWRVLSTHSSGAPKQVTGRSLIEQRPWSVYKTEYMELTPEGAISNHHIFSEEYEQVTDEFYERFGKKDVLSPCEGLMGAMAGVMGYHMIDRDKLRSYGNS